MNWRIRTVKYGTERIVAKNKDFKFACANINGWFISVGHNKKDIRFNTLWENIKFKDLEECKQWCENFDYKKHNCLGIDTNENSHHR